MDEDVPSDQVFLFSSMEHQISMEMDMPDGTSSGALTLAVVEAIKSSPGISYDELHRFAWDFIKNRHRPRPDPPNGV
jgi:hypothetical protein